MNNEFLEWLIGLGIAAILWSGALCFLVELACKIQYFFEKPE